MYIIKQIVMFMMTIQVISRTMDVLGDFGTRKFVSQSTNVTGILQALEKLKGYEIQIPEECNKRRFCENVTNYPEEIMIEIIEKLTLFENIYTQVNSVDKRYEDSDSECMCPSEARSFAPLAIADETGKWFLVLNSKENPVQTYVGEACKDDQIESYCQKLNIQPGYHGKCTETYVERKFMIVDEQNRITEKVSDRMPFCCECRAMRNKRY